MQKIDTEKILNVALEQLAEEKKIKVQTDVNEKVNNLCRQKFSMEELDVLEQIVQEQVDEDTGSLSFIMAVLAFVASTICSLIEQIISAKYLNELAGQCAPVVCVIIECIILIYIFHEFNKLSTIDKRKNASIRLKTAIMFYKKQLLNEKNKKNKKIRISDIK